jgi:hypothetical protein
VCKLLLSVILVTPWQFCIAQNSTTAIGARANGTGYSSSCLDDGWSLYNNTAGLTGVKDLQAGFTIDRVQGFSPFNRLAAYTAFPLRQGTIAAGIFRFGDDLYNEQIASLGYGHRIGITSLGAKASIVQYSVEGFGRKSLVTFGAGGITQITSWLTIGAYITNLSQPEVEKGEPLPVLLIAGMTLKASENVSTMLEVEKDIDYAPTVKAGVEYTIHKKFTARSGVNFNPQTGFFGVGFKSAKYRIDYAYSFVPGVMQSHQSTLVLFFKKRS